MSELKTVTVVLTHGVPLKNSSAKTVVLREPLLEDMIEAESDAAAAFSPLAFRRALVARQIVSLDGDALPVTPGMLNKLRPSDWNKLVAGLNEAEQLGEASAAAENDSSTASS
ncbi:phage tail assembly protein [Pseudogulbenkiania sp. MAI-1]|uniref:phage tail assembly protein n=1 Tax=Pseudogulbenkiania sp. MAI-1 TaxID=990370 RepID=UPI00045EB56C|nr:phage tail assembly protein [Pseudogulbenkiania sp. MAI-1]